MSLPPLNQSTSLSKRKSLRAKNFRLRCVTALSVGGEGGADNSELLVADRSAVSLPQTDTSDTRENCDWATSRWNILRAPQVWTNRTATLSLHPRYHTWKNAAVSATKEQVAASPRIKESVDKALAVDSPTIPHGMFLPMESRIGRVSSAKRFVAGLIYGQLPKGSYEEAERANEKAIELNPNRPDALH